MRIFGGFLFFIVVVESFHIKPKILNGFAAERNQYPFYAFLIMKSATKNISWCGGSLISNQFVLTAAHCTQPAVKMSVHLGTWKVKQRNETGRHSEFVKKKNIYIHPHYDAQYLINDVSLIKLEQPITFTANIRSIQIQNTCQPNDNANVIAIGNGFYSSKYNMAPVLQWIPMTTISIMECQNSHAFLRITGQKVICAKNMENRSIGKGDSGSPLIRDGNLIGICSFLGNSSAPEVPSSVPQGFVKLSSYHDWVKKITNLQLKICYS